jgi:hypothetical protein
MQRSSVSDPNPDPPDSHVFGSPGSGSIIQSFGSGSFYNSAKIVRKTLISTVLCKKTFLKYVFCFVLKVNDENSRIRIRIWIRIH